MENSNSKTEIMKPLFLKAGIPLALSIAGFIYAKIIAKKNILSASNPSPLELSKVCPLEPIDENTSFDEEIIGVRCRIEEVKELENVLIEVKNMLVLEASNVELLKRDISSMETEDGRFQDLVVEYLRLVEQLQSVKLENGMLRRRVRKILLRNKKEKSRIIRGNKLKIDAAEEEILRLCNDVETKCGFIKKLEDRIDELQNTVSFLKEEKNELLMRLNDAQNSASLTIKHIDEEYVTKEEYNEVVKELEHLRKERATEIAEFIYLKWNNACLKHELMRNNHEQEKQIEGKSNHLKVLEMNGNGEIQDSRFDHQEDGILVLGNKESTIGAATRNAHDYQRVFDESRTERSEEKRSSHDHGNSRRKKLLDKMRKWVEGNENVKVRNHEERERRSCSSA